MLSQYPVTSTGFLRGDAVIPGIVGLQIGTGAVAPAPSPSRGPLGPAGGPLPGERPYDDAAAKRHRARLLREDEEIVELIVQIVTKGLLD